MICISSSYLLSRMNNSSHNGANPLPPTKYALTLIPPPEPTEFIWPMGYNTIPSRQLRSSSKNLLLFLILIWEHWQPPHSAILCRLTLAPSSSVSVFKNKHKNSLKSFFFLVCVPITSKCHQWKRDRFVFHCKKTTCKGRQFRPHMISTREGTGTSFKTNTFLTERGYNLIMADKMFN